MHEQQNKKKGDKVLGDEVCYQDSLNLFKTSSFQLSPWDAQLQLAIGNFHFFVQFFSFFFFLQSPLSVSQLQDPRAAK